MSLLWEYPAAPVEMGCLGESNDERNDTPAFWDAAVLWEEDRGKTSSMPRRDKSTSADSPTGLSPKVGRVLLTCPIRGELTVAALAKDGLTPTEEARRIDFINYLIGRGYPQDCIAVETRVLTNLGERGRNSLRADVIVYDLPVAEARKKSTSDRLNHALVVAEIKRDSKSKTKGLAFQLEPAMMLLPSLSVLGVYWDDVNRILLYKSVVRRNGAKTVLVQQDSLANLPGYGQSYKSKPITLKTLVPAENLVATLLGLANVMRSHGVNDEQLRYKETVKLLLARYVDEKFATTRKDQVLDLQVFDGPDPAFEARAAAVYSVASTRYSRATTLFKPKTESELPPAALRDCVKAIQGVNLGSASSDVMQQVFMSFVPAVFKKSLDQYFTPVTLIDAMVDMTSIGPTDKVADPAMGTADFLTSAMARRTTAGDDDAPQRVFGVDKDERAFDLAVINMILNRDGQANLLRDDSLEKHKLWSNEMNVVLCNPPFGARTVESRLKVLSNYDLGHVWYYHEATGRWKMTSDCVGSQQLGLLFLERCYKLLAAGGRLAIIVPEGYLCTTSYGYVRQWLLEHFQIMSLVELPRRIFLKSEADLRSNILIARKLAFPGIPKVAYPIHIELVRKVGYKLGGGYTEIPRRDPETGLELRDASNALILDTDFSRVRSGYHQFLDETSGATEVPVGWRGATLADITSTKSMDMKPRRLSTKALENIRAIESGNCVRLGDIAQVVDDTVDLLIKIGGAAHRRPIEGKDIRAIEGTVVPQEPQRCWSIAARKSAAMYELQFHDIVVGLVRPERRNVGLLMDDGNDVVGSPDGVAVVRPLRSSASDYPLGWLFAALRSEACRLQFWTESGGTSYGKLSKQQINDVLIPTSTKADRLAVNAIVMSWAEKVTETLVNWESIGSSADRKPILNSPLFGLQDEDVFDDSSSAEEEED